MIDISYLKSVGFEQKTAEFLEWCFKNRDNLEFFKEKKTLELGSTQATLHFDDRGVVQVIDKNLKDKR